MPRSYEQHLLEARAREAAQQAQDKPRAKVDQQAQLVGLARGPKRYGAASDPQHPWRDDPSWREWYGWKEESARHMRGD